MDKTPMVPIPWDGARAEFSLRDWFAGQALAGLTAKHGVSEWGWTKTDTPDHPMYVEAYRLADGMLAAREAKP